MAQVLQQLNVQTSVQKLDVPIANASHLYTSQTLRPSSGRVWSLSQIRNLPRVSNLKTLLCPFQNLPEAVHGPLEATQNKRGPKKPSSTKAYYLNNLFPNMLNAPTSWRGTAENDGG